MRFVNIGFGNLLSEDKIIAAVAPDASPIKRMIADAKSCGLLIDATCGRKTRSVVIMDGNHLVLTSISLEILSQRLDEYTNREDEEVE